MSLSLFATNAIPSSPATRDLRTFQNPSKHHPQPEASAPRPAAILQFGRSGGRRQDGARAQPSRPPREADSPGALFHEQILSLPSASVWGVEVQTETCADRLGRAGETRGRLYAAPVWGKGKGVQRSPGGQPWRAGINHALSRHRKGP